MSNFMEFSPWQVQQSIASPVNSRESKKESRKHIYSSFRYSIVFFKKKKTTGTQSVDEKNEFLIIGTLQQLSMVDIEKLSVGDVSVAPIAVARNLGTWFDTNLSLVSDTHYEDMCITLAKWFANRAKILTNTLYGAVLTYSIHHVDSMKVRFTEFIGPNGPQGPFSKGPFSLLCVSLSARVESRVGSREKSTRVLSIKDFVLYHRYWDFLTKKRLR